MTKINKSSVVGFFALGLILHGTQGFAAQSIYAISSGDKLRVTVFEKPNFSGDFRVGPSGTITLPAIGRLTTIGANPRILEDLIADRLRQTVHLINPRVVVEVIEYRPIFVLGDVKKPGQYSYAPGFSVLQAVAIAGGHSIDNLDADSLTRNSVNRERARRKLDIDILEYWAALATRARLVAERTKQDKIVWPPVLLQYVKKANRNELIDSEQRKFDLRLREHSGKTEHFKSQIRQLDKEIRTLNSLGAAIDESKKLVERETADLEKLRAKGLIRNSRVFGLLRDLSELRGDRLRISVSILQAKQKISDIELKQMELQNGAKVEIINSIAKVEMKIIIHQRLQKAFRQELQVFDQLLAGNGSVQNEIGPFGYKIIRNVDGVAKILNAAESSVILPGDVVKVSHDIVRDGSEPQTKRATERY